MEPGQVTLAALMVKFEDPSNPSNTSVASLTPLDCCSPKISAANGVVSGHGLTISHPNAHGAYPRQHLIKSKSFLSTFPGPAPAQNGNVALPHANGNVNGNGNGNGNGVAGPHPHIHNTNISINTNANTNTSANRRHREGSLDLTLPEPQPTPPQTTYRRPRDNSIDFTVPERLLVSPRLVIPEKTYREKRVFDDSAIHRVTMANLLTSQAQQYRKYYYCPNTFIASNGEVYEIEPFQLPPPADIAALFKEKEKEKEKSLKTKDDTSLRRRPSTQRALHNKHYAKLQAPSPPPSPSSVMSHGKSFDFQQFSLMKYLQVEMFGVQTHAQCEPSASENIDNFLNVPANLERLLFFGTFVCLDVFLYVLTFLPVRIAYSLVLLAKKVILPNSKGHSFRRTHAYDLMRGMFLIVGCVILRSMNMSRVYHFIRGQSMIKLYVLTAMLEVFDKLLSSFGQDAFDSLYWSIREKKHNMKILPRFIIVGVYVCVHSLMLFLHVATLTVAINSQDQALMTLLISNNFAEIKSFVFKKFDKQNLFQLSCSDIVERFKISLFLLVILIVNLTQAPLEEIYGTFMYVCLLAVLGEVLADWIKHAFITKFNHIDASVYGEYAEVLRQDILNGEKENVILDHTYAITRRVGLAQLPLACVALRYIQIAIVSWGHHAPMQTQAYAQTLDVAAIIPPSVPVFEWTILAVRILCLFVILLLLKIATGVGLLMYAARSQNAALSKSDAAPTHHRSSSMERLANIERYTLWKGRIVG